MEDLGIEVERLEKEVSDEDAISVELPALEEEEDDKSEGRNYGKGNKKTLFLMRFNVILAISHWK